MHINLEHGARYDPRQPTSHSVFKYHSHSKRQTPLLPSSVFRCLISSTRSPETLDEIYDQFVETHISGSAGFTGGVDMGFVLGSQSGESITTGAVRFNIVDGGGARASYENTENSPHVPA